MQKNGCDFPTKLKCRISTSKQPSHQLSSKSIKCLIFSTSILALIGVDIEFISASNSISADTHVVMRTSNSTIRNTHFYMVSLFTRKTHILPIETNVRAKLAD